MPPSRIQAVENVCMKAPFGVEDELCWFYGELAGLDEISEGGADPAHLGFKSERIELRIHFTRDLCIDPVPIRVTIAVSSLDETVAALDERGLAYERISGLAATDRRIQVLDPAGNRVEFKQSWGRVLF